VSDHFQIQKQVHSYTYNNTIPEPGQQ
jgi:hypothetical protein